GIEARSAAARSLAARADPARPRALLAGRDRRNARIEPEEGAGRIPAEKRARADWDTRSADVGIAESGYLARTGRLHDHRRRRGWPVSEDSTRHVRKGQAAGDGLQLPARSVRRAVPHRAEAVAAPQS